MDEYISPPLPDEPTSFPPGGTALVIGAGGGIGGALVAALRARRDFVGVLAVSRVDGDLPGVDLSDEASIERLRSSLMTACHDLRLIMVATGFLSDERFKPERSWRALDPKHFAHSFALNAIGPALLMKHLLPLFPRAGKSGFAALSARIGSIGDNRLGGWHAYRASKAALNQIVRTNAVELARSRPESCLVALHPGTVATRLSAPFVTGDSRVQSPPTAAEALLGVIDRLSAAESGGFYAYDGKPIPW